MIVDDHEVVRLGLRAALEIEDDLDVVADVGDSRLVLQEAELSRPDVTLMDVRMPGIDGIETCRMLKQSMPEASVVMLTSFSDEKAVMASIMAGASGYLAQEHSSRGARVRRMHGRQRGVAAGPRRCLQSVEPTSGAGGQRA